MSKQSKQVTPQTGASKTTRVKPYNNKQIRTALTNSTGSPVAKHVEFVKKEGHPTIENMQNRSRGTVGRPPTAVGSFEYRASNANLPSAPHSQSANAQPVPILQIPQQTNPLPQVTILQIPQFQQIPHQMLQIQQQVQQMQQFQQIPQLQQIQQHHTQIQMQQNQQQMFQHEQQYQRQQQQQRQQQHQQHQLAGFVSPEMDVELSPRSHQLTLSREPYAKEIISHLLDTQVLTPRIAWAIHQNISAQMRVVLVDWLIEVAHEYHLHEQTLFLCIIYLDRCLSSYAVEKNRLQLLGISCLFLASKMEEVLPPPLKEFSYITDFTYDNRTILREEDKILDTLDWNLSYVTVHDFIATLLAYYNLIDVEKTHFANYLSLLSLTCLDLYQRYFPSELAWAIVMLTAYTFDTSWPLHIQICTHNSCFQKEDNYERRKACVEELHRYCTTPRSLQAARQKYSKSVYGCVSSRVIPPLVN